MMNTRSIDLKEQFERRIREAEIMMRGGDPEQRERGRQRLREVVSQAEGSVYAQRALEILTAAEPRVPAENRPTFDHGYLHWATFPFLGLYEQIVCRGARGIAIVFGLMFILIAPHVVWGILFVALG